MKASGSDKYHYSDGTECRSTVADLSEGSKEGGKDYSTTNLQMEGVDESDIAKIDGSYIYTGRG
ncbi:MAG: beta-propeller domain-containing protein [Roseburia sp.]